MKTLDLRTQYRALYQPSAKQPELVEVPEFLFLFIDGRIDEGDTPDTSAAFREALQALYGAAYTLKFMSKLRKTRAVDYPVMALEAIWWVEDRTFDIGQPGNCGPSATNAGSSSVTTGSGGAAAWSCLTTTRSTLAIHAAPRRRSSRRFCATR
jgi:hypothetical protein